MDYLKFNKSELVNLSYSLRREIILANKNGAYCNTSIITCNTRKYHGLLAVTLDRFGGDKYLMLSSLDETLVINGKQFNLGIHCYGDVYEPRGHKYIVDFEADPVPHITYKVGDVVFSKTLIIDPHHDQLMIRYTLDSSEKPVVLQLRPFLPFRNVHSLTEENQVVDGTMTEVPHGHRVSLYRSFPNLYLQVSDSKAKYSPASYWYKGITYTDEYRRGFDCREDLYSPGYYEMKLLPGKSVVFSASMVEEDGAALSRNFAHDLKAAPEISDGRDQLRRWADILLSNHNGRKKVNAGLSWLYTGLLRESLKALPGLTLYASGDTASFEEVLDNIVADEQERLTWRTTQIEAPFYFVTALQAYIEFGADEKAVWEKYGKTVKIIIESYSPGIRAEASVQPDGLIWSQKTDCALSWMNAYIDGKPVTERAGYQVETNALWYNALCFAIDMEKKYGTRGGKAFVKNWTMVRDLAKDNFMKKFWDSDRGYLADYVDNSGRHMEVRPNQLYALWVENSPLDEECFLPVMRVVEGELLTKRGVRTLSPRDNDYKGVYDGSQTQRDLAYHQGSTRPYLLEQYVGVGFRIHGAAFLKKAEWLIEGFYEDLNKHGVGAFSELYDGDPPQEAHGAISSALSTAAILSIERMIEKYKEEGK